MSLLASLARRFCNTRISKNEISSHLQGYMRANSTQERAVYMLLQEEQLSDFSPLYFEFCRFSGGSKLNRSPRCRQSFSTDAAKIGIFSECCNICELFFLYLAAKLWQKGEMCKSFSVLFISFDTIIELLHKKRYADLYNWGIDWLFMLIIFIIGRINYVIFCRLPYIDYLCGKIRLL